MEQVLIMNQSGVRSVESQIGVKFGESFIIEDSCLDALQDIANGLDGEDVMTRPYRCQLAVFGTVKNCLIPLVLHLEDDENDMLDDKEDILNLCLKILAHLAQTYESLINDSIPQIAKGRVSESCKKSRVIIDGLVKDIKKHFIETDIISVLHLKIQKILNINRLKVREWETINSLFLLYSYLLFPTDDHLETTIDQSEGNSTTALLKLLFDHGFQDIFISCSSSEHRSVWVVSMVQLITMLFKDSEHTINSLWFQIEETESTDSQYESLYENTTVRSQSSNTSTEVHCVVEDTAKRRNSLNMHEKMNEKQLHLVVVREKLREFSLEFLKNGWPDLIYGTKAVLLSKNFHNLPNMYYLWNVSFTLMLAQRQALPFSHIKPLLSQYITDYLVYTAVTATEQLQLVAQQCEKNSRAITELDELTSELSMALTGIKYQLRCMQYYWMSEHITEKQRGHLLRVKCMLAQSKEIRALFSLLHRQYDPSFMSLGYLTMLVNVHHDFIVMCDLLKDVQPSLDFFDIREHIQSFANKDTILTYSCLLSNYDLCSLSTLEKVFTMLHHIGMDLRRMDLIIQLPIMHAFNDMDESPIIEKLSEKCTDLIQNAFEYFLSCAQADPRQLAYKLTETLLGNTSQNDLSKEKQPNTEQMDSNGDDAWKSSELEELEELALQFEGSMTFLDDVVTALHDRGIDHSAREVIVKLQQMDCDDKSDVTSQTAKNSDHAMDASTLPTPNLPKTKCSVQKLISQLQESGKEHYLHWLQNVLLEMIYIHLGGTMLGKPYPEEPVTMHFIASGKSIPLVAYTLEQEEGLQDLDFSTLLYKMDLEPPNIIRKEIYPRIPEDWSVDELMSKATLLADVDMDKLKFSEEQLTYHKEKRGDLKITNTKVNESPGERYSSSNVLSEDMWIFYLKSLQKDKLKSTETVPWWQKDK